MYAENSVPVIDAPMPGVPGNDAPYVGTIDKGPRVAPVNPVWGMRVVDRDDLFPRGFSEEELRRIYAGLSDDRHNYDMLTESADFEEVDEYYNPGETEVSAEEIYEAIVIEKFARAEHRMNAVVRTLNKFLSGKELQALPAIVGTPKKSGAFAYVTVQLPFNDGQTVSAIFHSPEGDKRKIGPNDTLIAFRWLLNRRDITHVLAPEEGAEISLETIGKRLTQLVEKNSERFQRTQKEAATERKALEETKQAVKDAEAKQGELMDSVAQASKDAETIDARLSNTLTQLEKQKVHNAELRATLEGLQKSGANRKDGDNMKGKNGSNDTSTGKDDGTVAKAKEYLAKMANQRGVTTQRKNACLAAATNLLGWEKSDYDPSNNGYWLTEPNGHKQLITNNSFDNAWESFCNGIEDDLKKLIGDTEETTQTKEETKTDTPKNYRIGIPPVGEYIDDPELIAALPKDTVGKVKRIGNTDGQNSVSTPLFVDEAGVRLVSLTKDTDGSTWFKRDVKPFDVNGYMNSLADHRFASSEEYLARKDKQLKDWERKEAEKKNELQSSLPLYMKPVSALAQGITDGLIDDLAEVGRVLDEAAEEAEKDGRFDEFEEMFNKAADTLTELLKKKQGAM